MAINVALVPHNTVEESTLQASTDDWMRLIDLCKRAPRLAGLAKLLEQELYLASGPVGAKRITIPTKQADAIRQAASRLG